MNILEHLLQALLCSVIRKNYQFRVYFLTSHTKARILVLSWTSEQEKLLCKQVNSFVCLAGSHLVKDYSLKIKCFKCSKRSHVVLCDLEENCHSSSNSSSVNKYCWSG